MDVLSDGELQSVAQHQDAQSILSHGNQAVPALLPLLDQISSEACDVLVVADHLILILLRRVRMCALLGL